MVLISVTSPVICCSTSRLRPPYPQSRVPITPTSAKHKASAPRTPLSPAVAPAKGCQLMLSLPPAWRFPPRRQLSGIISQRSPGISFEHAGLVKLPDYGFSEARAKKPRNNQAGGVEDTREAEASMRPGQRSPGIRPTSQPLALWTGIRAISSASPPAALNGRSGREPMP